MSSASGVPIGVKAKTFTANLNQSANTYDLATASGDVYVISYQVKSGTAATGLTSASIQTNNTVPVSILASTLLASLTGDTALSNSTGGFLLESGKKIRYTIVGTGTAGTVMGTFYFIPVTSGADIS
jgi:hypothetical protein